MAYVWQTWLAAEIREAMVLLDHPGRVIEVEGWKTRGRPASTGDFDPRAGTVGHHTASRASVSNPHPTLRLCIVGRSDLPGPIAHTLPDYIGDVYVIAAGRANVNGRVGRAEIGFPVGADGNAIALGHETDIDGYQALPYVQRRALAITQAVVIRHYGNRPDRATKHQAISATGKWDIGELTVPQIRADVEQVLRELDAATRPHVPTDEEQIMALSKEALTAIRGVVADETAKSVKEVAPGLVAAAVRAELAAWSSRVIGSYAPPSQVRLTVTGGILGGARYAFAALQGVQALARQVGVAQGDLDAIQADVDAIQADLAAEEPPVEPPAAGS
jgi:hypothetical protein